MIRKATALCAAMVVLTALNGCGLARSKAISAAQSPEQLTKYTDKQLCNPLITITPIVAAERGRRELGDCSAAHMSCKASGFQPGTDRYLACRQFVGAENAAKAARRQAGYLQMMRSGFKMMQAPTPAPSPLSTDTTLYNFGGHFMTCTRTGNIVNCL